MMKILVLCLIAISLLGVASCTNKNSEASSATPSEDVLTEVQNASQQPLQSWRVVTIRTVSGQNLQVQEDVMCPMTVHRTTYVVDQYGNKKVSEEYMEIEHEYYNWDPRQEIWFSHHSRGNDHCGSGPSGGFNPLLAMVQRAKGMTTKKGEVRQVNGFSCRDWELIQSNGSSFATLCVDEDTHLPYEVRTPDMLCQYSMWNQPIIIKAPDMNQF